MSELSEFFVGLKSSSTGSHWSMQFNIILGQHLFTVSWNQTLFCDIFSEDRWFGMSIEYYLCETFYRLDILEFIFEKKKIRKCAEWCIIIDVIKPFEERRREKRRDTRKKKKETNKMKKFFFFKILWKNEIWNRYKKDIHKRYEISHPKALINKTVVTIFELYSNCIWIVINTRRLREIIMHNFLYVQIPNHLLTKTINNFTRLVFVRTHFWTALV